MALALVVGGTIGGVLPILYRINKQWSPTTSSKLIESYKGGDLASCRNSVTTYLPTVVVVDSPTTGAGRAHAA